MTHRAAWILVPLAGIAGAALVWTGFLRRQVRKRTRELMSINRSLHEKERFLETVVDNLPVAVYGKDPNHDFAYSLWNPRSAEVFGPERRGGAGADGPGFRIPGGRGLLPRIGRAGDPAAHAAGPSGRPLLFHPERPDPAAHREGPGLRCGGEALDGARHLGGRHPPAADRAGARAQPGAPGRSAADRPPRQLGVGPEEQGSPVVRGTVPAPGPGSRSDPALFPGAAARGAPGGPQTLPEGHQGGHPGRPHRGPGPQAPGNGRPAPAPAHHPPAPGGRAGQGCSASTGSPRISPSAGTPRRPCGRPRSSRASGFWPAASPTISTTCSPPSWPT